MVELTKEQKKIIVIGAVVVIALLSFWRFIYVSSGRKVALMKKELVSVETQIAEIISITEGRDLVEAVKDLKISLWSLESQLPARNEIVIDALSKAARDLNIEVRKIVSSGKRPSDRQVSGIEAEEMPISMDLAGGYQNLGEYLSILRNKFPVLVRVQKLNIKGKEGKTKLDISLEILAYLSRKK